MNDLLNTLPGDIPGLLRRLSPIVYSDGDRGVFLHFGEDGYPISYYEVDGEEKESEKDSVALDLTDPTGRAHAAWWVRSIIRWPETDQDDELLTCAEKGADMMPPQIDTLARIVLRLAGRTP